MDREAKDINIHIEWIKKGKEEGKDLQEPLPPMDGLMAGEKPAFPPDGAREFEIDGNEDC